MCTTTYLDDPARNPAQEQEDEKARRASIEKWEAFCKPQRTYDKEGVVRLVYARRRAASSAAASSTLSLLAISEEHSELAGSMNSGALSRPKDR